jgi:hypothetical protein
MIYARIIYGVLVLGLGLWAVFASSRPAVPTAAKALSVNHKITQGDLETPEIAALINYFLRTSVGQGKQVTRDMVGETAGIPVIDTGLVAVVNLAKGRHEKCELKEGDDVRIISGGKQLDDPGKLLSMTCDEDRCAAAIRLEKTPTFDSKALQNAEIEKSCCLGTCTPALRSN